MTLCGAITSQGRPCRNTAVAGDTRCPTHGGRREVARVQEPEESDTDKRKAMGERYFAAQNTRPGLGVESITRLDPAEVAGLLPNVEDEMARLRATIPLRHAHHQERMAKLLAWIEAVEQARETPPS